MIKKLLRNIRQKPKAVREQYAFWIACTLTSIVVIVWVMTRIDPFETPETASEVTVVESDTLTSFIDEAQNQIDSVRQEVQNMLPASESRSALSTTSSSTPNVGVPVTSTTTRQEIRIATTTSSSTN